jgi:DSF synthase
VHSSIRAVTAKHVPHELSLDLDEFESEFDAESAVLWGYFNPRGAPSFTPRLLADIRRHDHQFESNNGLVFHEGRYVRADYYVAASRIKGIYNLGGDLAYFIECIERGDRARLMSYAALCIDNVYARTQNYHVPNLITIALVQGDALGGGFETALASNVIIAEEQAKLGFPEILFNLFPGMGAYSLLARRVGQRRAEEMILSGNPYSAAQLQEIGVVDVVVPRGHGQLAVYDYIQKNQRHKKATMACYQARRTVFPVTHQELMDITTVWVDAAFKLDARHRRVMTRIVRSQQRYR